MYRCFALAVALTSLPVGASAQMQRLFPADALRGEIEFLQPPEIRLNKAGARLAPGSRIRAQDNMLQMSGSLIGSKFAVNYTIDTYGLVRDVWILRPEETRMRPWPRTLAETQAWAFDPVAQTWSKP
ncbi:MAG: hypothetical protein ABI564_02675 [Ideonella sp.]